MRFLADENCDFAATRALREAGHDVALVRDLCPGASDEAVASLARGERRILLTEDKDFGQLVQAMSSGDIGVILIRFPANARSVLGATLLGVVAALTTRLESGFTVVEPMRFRIADTTDR